MVDVAPFPWFGSKVRAAELVWSVMGEVGAYCEPFAGSLACLLARPNPYGLETVVDRDGMLVNFWRALRAEPDLIAEVSDWPSTEVDLTARHRWLVSTGRERLASLMDDPDFYDVKVAAWWLWGIRIWVGSGWCRTRNGKPAAAAIYSSTVPSSTVPSSIDRELLRSLSERLRSVRVLCGDWSRGVSPASLVGTLRASGPGRTGITGVLLDPPYPEGEGLYGDTTGVCREVWRWAEEHGADPHLRIVVCGHAGDWDPPDGWQTIAWSGRKAYNSTKGSGERERLWCSPACLPYQRKQATLF